MSKIWRQYNWVNMLMPYEVLFVINNMRSLIQWIFSSCFKLLAITHMSYTITRLCSNNIYHAFKSGNINNMTLLSRRICHDISIRIFLVSWSNAKFTECSHIITKLKLKGQHINLFDLLIRSVFNILSSETLDSNIY